MKKTFLFLAALVIIAVAVIQTKSFTADAKNTAPPSAAAAVRSLRITAEGRVTTYPGAQVIVASDVAGTVVRLLVDEKSYVRAGQVIAEIRADDTRASVAQARARVNESAADVRLFEAEVNRADQLYESKVGTKQVADRARRDLDAAIARRETSLADARRLEAVLDKTVLRAPISGVVTQRFVHQGESVKEQASVITIADLKKMRIEAEVDEFDAGRVRLGSEVLVKAEGYDGQQWKARVEEIPDAVVARKLKPEDPGRPTDTRVLLVKVALLEKTPLKLGQRVEMEITGK